MKILTGPPGTGKTYRAVDEAVIAVDGSLPSGGRSGVVARHEALVATGDIVWVTFHPSYSYEDFVEGFRPEVTPAGPVFKVRPGPFLRACKRCVEDTVAARFATLGAGDVITSSTGTEYTVEYADGSTIALASDVKRSNAVGSRKIDTTNLWTIERLVGAGVTPEELSIAGTKKGKRTAAAQKSGLPSTVLANSGHIRAVLEFVSDPAPKAPRPVAIVVDELNRADLSRVFGELMTLLEKDKRAGAPEERQVVLPYSQQRLTVPATLSVIGTMNTSDRSLAEIDLALRRRFDFVELRPDVSLCPTGWGGVSVSEWLERLNESLAALGFADNKIGHAELMEHALEARRASENWPNDDDGRLKALAEVLRTKIVPLLLDLFRVDWRQAEAALGKRGLITSVPLHSAVTTALDEQLVGDEPGPFALASWWDPRDPAWNGPQFAAAMTP